MAPERLARGALAPAGDVYAWGIMSGWPLGFLAPWKSSPPRLPASPPPHLPASLPCCAATAQTDAHVPPAAHAALARPWPRLLASKPPPALSPAALCSVGAVDWRDSIQRSAPGPGLRCSCGAGRAAARPRRYAWRLRSAHAGMLGARARGTAGHVRGQGPAAHDARCDERPTGVGGTLAGAVVHIRMLGRAILVVGQHDFKHLPIVTYLLPLLRTRGRGVRPPFSCA
jgi:hypothetical protein